MLSEQQVRANMVRLIQELKNSFNEDDMKYLKVSEMRFEDRFLWADYSDIFIALLLRIRIYQRVLELKNDDFKKIFNDIKRRDSA